MNSCPVKETILAKAAERGPLKSTCPSEIARALYPKSWRKHMDEVRAAAVELQQAGKVILTQKGAPVDPENFKGPVRIQCCADQQ